MKFLIVVLMMLASMTMLAAEISMPFDICKTRNAVLVLVEVNGRTLRLLLDTDSEHTVLSSALARGSALDLKQATFSRGPGMFGDAVWSSANLRFADLRFDHHSVLLMNLDQVKRLHGKDIDGLLGQDILSEFSSVTMDFKGRRLVLAR